MKIGTYEINNKWLGVGAIVLVAIFIFIFLSIPSCQKPVTPQQTINEIKVGLEKQYAEMLKEKDILVNKKDEKISTLQAENNSLRSKNVASVINYNRLSKKYSDLKESYANVILPKTDKELRDRYTVAGFSPAPVGVCGGGYICFPTGYR